MKQDGFQVVAELYRFLSSFDSSAISTASRLPNISENLRAALIALHQETTDKHSNRAKPTISSSTSPKKKISGSLDAMGLLTDKKRFPTKHSLQEIANALGIKIIVSTKDSQERIARRIAAIVNKNPTVSEKLYDLMGAANDTQTAGWINLIRRSS